VTWDGKEENADIPFYCWSTDATFMKMVGLQLVEGILLDENLNVDDVVAYAQEHQMGSLSAIFFITSFEGCSDSHFSNNLSNNCSVRSSYWPTDRCQRGVSRE